MIREPTVKLAHSIRGWTQELHFFLMDHGGAMVRGYVMSAADATAEKYDVLIVDDVASFLSVRLVSQLRRSGIGLVGVYDSSDTSGTGKQRLLDLGITEALPDGTSPTEFVAAIVRVCGPMLSEELNLELLGEAGQADELDDNAAPSEFRKGCLVAVVAATGGAGATETAIGLAASLRKRGSPAVLVDADEQAPSVAQRLGLQLHPNIRTAVDVVHHATGRLEETITAVPAAGIGVVCGLPNPRDWFELRPGEVLEVLGELANTHSYVVANVGPRIEDLPELGGPARYSVTRAVVGLADLVMLVTTASPTGVTRAVEWVADGLSLVEGTPVHIVINQHPRSAFVAAEIDGELRRNLDPESLSVVPFDRRVPRAAWEGTLVPKGPFTKAVERLTAHVPVTEGVQ